MNKRATYTYRKTDTHFVVPVIRSIQGGKIFYAANLRMRHVVELIPEVDKHTAVEERAQRSLNVKRAEKISEYIDENKENYVLPALTVSLLETGMRRTKFEPIAEGEDMGELYIPLASRTLISDGQHRLRAINNLIQGKISDIHDSIAVTIYDNVSLNDAKQLFTDINQNASKPAGSINSLFDSRNSWNSLAVVVSKKAKILIGRTEYEKSSCTAKSHNTFPLKTVVDFCKKVKTQEPNKDNIEESANYIVEILDSLHTQIRDWTEITKTLCEQDELEAMENKESQSAVQLSRYLNISVSAVALESLALYMREAQAQIFMRDKNFDNDQRIKAAAEGLKGINWSKDAELWQGRCIKAGKLVKNRDSVVLNCECTVETRWL